MLLVVKASRRFLCVYVKSILCDVVVYALIFSGRINFIKTTTSFVRIVIFYILYSLIFITGMVRISVPN